MSALLLVLLGTILYLAYKLSTRNFNYWKSRNVFYFKPIPLLGNFLDLALLRLYIGEFMAKLYNSTKEPFFGIYGFNTPVLVVRDVEIIKHILIKDFRYFDNRTVTSCEHDPIVGHSLFFSKNPEWKIMRNKMSPLYTSGKLRAMLPLVNKCGESLERYLKETCSDSPLDAKEVCAKYTTDVITRCAFGIDAKCLENEDAEFRRIGKLLFEFRWTIAFQQFSYFYMPMLVKLFKIKFFDGTATAFLKKAFWDSLNQRELSGEKGNDVIDAIIALKNSEEFRRDVPDFEGDKILAQTVVFFVGGFETTSTMMSFTLYELGLHPQIQQKVRNEIRRCFQEHGAYTYQAVKNMKYLHMCVLEALRKYPLAPFLDRACNEDYKIPNSDIVIEKGTAVYIPTFGLQHDPQYFPNPDKYEPERFSSENIDSIIPCTFIPFGEGPRNCIGQNFGYLSLKLGIIHMLNNFLIEKSSITPDKIEFEPKSFGVASKVGVPLTFKRLPSSAA